MPSTLFLVSCSGHAFCSAAFTVASTPATALWTTSSVTSLLRCHPTLPASSLRPLSFSRCSWQTLRDSGFRRSPHAMRQAVTVLGCRTHTCPWTRLPLLAAMHTSGAITYAFSRTRAIPWRRPALACHGGCRSATDTSGMPSVPGRSGRRTPRCLRRTGWHLQFDGVLASTRHTTRGSCCLWTLRPSSAAPSRAARQPKQFGRR
mmetsp:Transcript_91410/g.261706  ORF Transcript_91410/g.261706 Transcript_91410/m.261706 type:complete len:204 (+) Transcript_91410:1490-2101(+)